MSMPACVSSLPSSQTTSGTQFPLSFIPDIPAGKVLGLSLIPITSSQLSLVASDIPNLDGSKITSGNIDIGAGNVACHNVTFDNGTITNGSINLTLGGVSKFSVNHTNGAVTCKQLSTSGGSLTTGRRARGRPTRLVQNSNRASGSSRLVRQCAFCPTPKSHCHGPGTCSSCGCLAACVWAGTGDGTPRRPRRPRPRPPRHCVSRATPALLHRAACPAQVVCARSRRSF